MKVMFPTYTATSPVKSGQSPVNIAPQPVIQSGDQVSFTKPQHTSAPKFSGLFGKSDNEKLLEAAKIGDAIRVDRLLRRRGVKINTTDNEGATPLHWAARNNNVDVALSLIDKGADINAKCHQGYTPLHGAVVYGHRNLIHTLVERGADVNASGNYGITPIHAASF
jgi:ankyrin repeat protein